MSASELGIAAPLSGWSMPLAEVPDAVFAQGMAGEGAAIDPTGGTVVAPFDGVVVDMKGARHAVTVRHASGAEVLVHVGIDTVALAGAGFDMRVRAGDVVKRGQLLMRFDLDLLARRAPSLATPVVVTAGGRVTRRREACRVAAGEDWMQVAIEDPRATTQEGAAIASAALRVPFDHGLHVRPAAQVAAAVRPFDAEVTLHLGGRSASTRSTVAMMALGAGRGDVIEARAVGPDAVKALEALRTLLAPVTAAESGTATQAPFTRGRIDAAIASRGLALGTAHRWSGATADVVEAGAGEAKESAALDAALAQVHASIETLETGSRGGERELLAAHRELLRDPALLEEARVSMRRGKSAAFAWRSAIGASVALLEAAGDARMRERAADLRDLEGQVLRALSGAATSPGRSLEGVIVLAEELLPSQFVALARGGAVGFCTAAGGATSHVALLAAAAGMPALVGAGPRVLAIAEGTPLVLDAEAGWLDVAPPPADRASIAATVSRRAQERAADSRAARDPCETRDGVRIAVHANLGARDEVAGAIAAGAEGCGLLRTEFLFLERREAPGEDEQAREYAAIAAALGGRPLAIRTLDAGADKPLAYLPQPREDNPALGLRGLRAFADAPELFATQVRAVIRAAGSAPCKLLLPMVTDVADVIRARAVLDASARALGAAPVALGVMIETPSSALLAAELAAVADFLSIGTNDLAQYTLAIDRGHPRLAARLDALHPAVLRLVALVVQGARARGRPVSVCGALASDVEALPILVGLGIREISATPAMIPRLKRGVRELHAGECEEVAGRALAASSAAEARTLSSALKREEAQP